MKKLRRLAAALIAAAVMGAMVLPAAAAFEQSVLNGIVLIRSGAPMRTGP